MKTVSNRPPWSSRWTSPTRGWSRYAISCKGASRCMTVCLLAPTSTLSSLLFQWDSLARPVLRRTHSLTPLLHILTTFGPGLPSAYQQPQMESVRKPGRGEPVSWEMGQSWPERQIKKGGKCRNVRSGKGEFGHCKGSWGWPLTLKKYKRSSSPPLAIFAIGQALCLSPLCALFFARFCSYLLAFAHLHPVVGSRRLSSAPLG
jgi:hypothetical protein